MDLDKQNYKYRSPNSLTLFYFPSPRTRGPPCSAPPASLKSIHSPFSFCPLRISFRAMDNPATGMWTYLAVAVAAAALASSASTPVPGLGVNLGTITSHPMLPSTIVQTIQANGIKRVKLFDADDWTLSAFIGTDIEVIVAIPNNQLARMSHDYENAKEWVKQNVTKYDHDGGIKIKYVSRSLPIFVFSTRSAASLIMLS